MLSASLKCVQKLCSQNRNAFQSKYVNNKELLQRFICHFDYDEDIAKIIKSARITYRLH